MPEDTRESNDDNSMTEIRASTNELRLQNKTLDDNVLNIRHRQ